jgi:hypothetical protein
MGISLRRGPMGNVEGGSFFGNFERYAYEALVTSISLRWGADGEPGGGTLSPGLRETGRGGFWERSVCFCGDL